MGWNIDWASTAGSDFNRDLGFAHTEEELKPFLEGEIPQRSSRWRRPAARTRRDMWPRAGPERLRALGWRHLPHLRDHGARTRADDGLLLPARPDAAGTQRGVRVWLRRHDECEALAPERQHDPRRVVELSLTLRGLIVVAGGRLTFALSILDVGRALLL